MLLNAWIVFLWVALLACLGLLIWAVVLYQAWSLWCVPLIFVAVILLAVVGRWGARRGYAWHLRRRMKNEQSQSLQDKTPNLDLDWVAGLRRLHRSRLGRMGSPLYALPWFLMLSDSASGKNSLLSQSGLASALPATDRREGESGAVGWWFLEQGVVIDPAGRLVEGNSTHNVEWKRLLYWLLRSRRREPLNGVVIVIDCEHLLGDTDERLAEQGQNLRQRLDDLVKMFGARLPVYFIMAGAEALPGFTRWSEDLTSVQREQPFGLLCQNSDSTATAFLDEMFSGLVERLSALRIEQGERALPDEQVFDIPERIAGLRPRLEKLLLPAFAANPYNEPPLLGGLFLTAQAPLQDGRREGWFSHQLLGQVLPAQRYAYKPIDHWLRWFPVNQLAMIVWLGLCAGVGVLLVIGNQRSHDVLVEALNEPSLGYESGVELDVTLQALRRLNLVINDLSEKELSGWRGLLPFSGYIETLQASGRAHYVKVFNDEIRVPVFDGLLSTNLQHALASGDPRLIAAYVEFFVRRINLLDARLGNRSLSELKWRPEPGLLYEAYGPGGSVSAAQLASVGDMYANYLDWQTDLGELRRERANVLLHLDSMALESRPHSWLIAWAEQHGNLPPICLSEYWSDENNPPVALSGAYTSQGHHAVLNLLEEVGQARRDHKMWAAQRERFLSEYQADAQSAWHQFIQRFLLSARTRLNGQDDWRQALSVVGTDNDPFLKLLHRSAERFELIAPGQRAAWASRAMDIDRLLKLANQSELHNEAGALRNLNVTNAIGGDVLKGIANGGPVSEGVSQVRMELAQAKSLAQFQQLMATVTADLQKSDAQAFQVALDTWGYASDPQIKAAPLWAAHSIRDKLARTFSGVNPSEDVVWALATGSLDFSVRYAGQIAACQLQREWNGQLLSIIEGVEDSFILNTLLYGDRGQLPAFMNGPVKSFTQHTQRRYSPREALGSEVPLTGAFYAYVSRMQHAQHDIASTQRKNQVAQATREQKKQALESEEKALQVTKVELQQKLTMLQAVTAVVELSTTASQVNLGARQLPRQTRLSMQCNGHSTVLDNYNFPTSASFVWAPKACSDVSLEVFFGGFKLVKHWTGDRAFIDFLGTLNGGRHTFTPDDFPGQRDLMGSENVTAIQLTYRQQGEKDLMESYAQADQVQRQINTLNNRLKVINELLAAMGIQAAEREVRLAESGSSVEQGLAGVLPPKQIAWCWRRDPVETLASSRSTQDVEVGIYNGDSRIKKLENQLRAMGYETRRESVLAPLGLNLQKLVVVGLADTAAARKALDEVVRKLNVPTHTDDASAEGKSGRSAKWVM